MDVLFYGNVINYTDGEKLCEVKDCTSVRELIDELGNCYGDGFRQFLLGEDTCFFLVNGKGLMMTGGLNTRLQSGDKIEVLPFADAG
ncbi:MAG: MoaD/ThiS family protein [Treponema sp.]|nr:MoaD/ThiS family protein [Treponema sp.]